MGDFRKNPKTPFEVWVPNKIRKRIAMHEKEDKTVLEKIVASPLLTIAKAIAKPKKSRGSLWSRFTSKVASIFQIKPGGVRD